MDGKSNPSPDSCGVQWHQFLPSFGSDAAGPACDGAVYVGEVGVIPKVVPCTNLHIIARGEEKVLFFLNI